MTTNLPNVKSALVLAPHPDDEALGCGGALTLLNRGGTSSTVVFLTDGERLHGSPSSDIAKIRREEARKASVLLGCKEPLFLGIPDGEVNIHQERIYEKLYEIVLDKRPDVIFSPSPCDFHNDHIAAAGVAIDLLKNPGSFRLAFYEIYSTLRFTHLVEIADARENKRQAILNYRVSLYERPELYVGAALGLNAQRSIFTEKSSHYEAFWIIEKPLSEQEIMEWIAYRKR